MTRRLHLQAVFARQPVARPPVCLRMDLWHQHAVRTGVVPEACRGLNLAAIEDRLGFCRSARWRAFPEIVFASGPPLITLSAAERVEVYRFPDGALTRRTALAEDLEGHIVRYPLQTRADYELLLGHLRAARLTCDLAGFEAFDRAVGDAGLPLLIVGPCPAHRIMLQFAGYEGFYLHLADFPALVEEVIAALEALYRRDVWPVVERSGTALVLHGAHFSSQMTPPSIFERFFAPYFKDFIARLHAVGKKVLWHADAEMGALLHHVAALGFDGADCLATAPLTPYTLADYFEAWRGRIVCWGGLPGILFDPSYPPAAFKTCVEQVRAATAGRNDVIIGVSDNVMPGAEWERLRYVGAVFGGGGF